MALMVEAVTVLVALMMIAGLTYAGFLFGQDHAERKAGETIANLRRQAMAYRARLNRVEARNASLSAALHYARPADPPVPDWMRDDAS